MGIVLKVMDLDTGEIVALKMLKPGMASAQAMQENLRKEVCLARKVTHKNVCRIYEFNRSDGAACISMEFVEGESLASKLRRVGALPLDETLEIARQICAGLHEAHLQGIVHRDLKPANIMVDSSGTVKIMDFGIARLTEEDGQMTGTIAGTPSYMAPEQLELKTMGPQTDIYSLGLLLYEMLTDVPAFEGDTPIATALKQIRELPKRPSEIVPEFPARLEAIIMKCLRKDPRRRYQTVDELAAALETEYAIHSRVSWRAGLQQQIVEWASQIKRHRGVRAAAEQIRAAGPVFRELGLEIRRTTLDANQFFIEQGKKVGALVEAKDWRAVGRTPSVQAGALLLAGAIVFGMAAGRSGRANGFSAAQFAGPSVQAFPPADARAGFGGESETRQGGGIGVAGASAGATAAGDSSNAKSNLPATTSASKKIKAQTGVAGGRKSSGVNSRAVLSAEIRPSAPLAQPDERKIVGPQTEVEAPSIAAAVSTSAPPKLIDGADEEKPAPNALYLEAGSFKDSSWAQNAVEKLKGLGYHAISVHQSRLWVQSFHVQVGPFTDMREVETAQKGLAAQGFKTHLVK